ncbi:MAG: phage shock protein A [Dehalococcoidia bacterium]|nr:MAG: phage shock protein A [Dehalococcoidia bacterium]
MAGYTSILDRVTLLVSANINALLDKALSLNRLAVFDEYLNRMGEAYESLQTAEGIERGRTRTLLRQLEETEAEVNKLDDDVDRLLQKGERGLAAARQAVLNTKLGLLEDIRENLQQSQLEAQKLADAKAKLQAQIEVTKARRQELVSLIEQKRASDLRLKAQQGIRDIGDKTKTDALIERARQELEIAQGKEEAARDTLEARIDEVLGVDEIEQQLAAREARLGLKSAETSQLPEGTR